MSSALSMLKRAAATASAAVTAAVNTMGGGGIVDEVLDGYKVKLDALQKEMTGLKERCALFGKATMNVATSANEVANEFRSAYRASQARQQQLNMFSNAQQRVDECAFKAYSIDSYGSHVLGVLDEWLNECNRVVDDIKNTETALEEVRQLSGKVASLRAAKEKRLSNAATPGASTQSTASSVKEDQLLSAAEEQLSKYERNYQLQRTDLDRRVTAFIEGRYGVLDSVFVRFMELQAEFAASYVQCTQPFNNTISVYRKRFPINSSSSSGNATGTKSPTQQQQQQPSYQQPNNAQHPGQSTSPLPDVYSSLNPNPSTGSTHQQPAQARHHQHTHTHKHKQQDDEDESDEDESDEEDSDEDDSDEDEDTDKGRSTHTHTRAHTHSQSNARQKGAAAAANVSSPRVSSVGAVSPRSSVNHQTNPSINTSVNQPGSQPASPRSSAAPSPDLLTFEAEKAEGNELLDLFGSSSSVSAPAAANRAASPTNRQKAANQPTTTSSSSNSSNSMGMFDWSGPAKPSSPTPNIPSSSAAGRTVSQGKGPTHSSSMDFDPFAKLETNTTTGKAAASHANSSNAVSGSSSSTSSTSVSVGVPASTLKKESSKSQLNVVAKGLVKTDQLDDHIAEQQQSRLTQLRENEAKAEQEAEDKRLAVHALEDRLKSWSEKDGQKRGIRTLLSTLQTVLWSNSGWKPVGLADLIDLNAIKKVQRKAMLLVHPDKLTDATAEQKVIAEHCFDALNSAFDRFIETGQ